MTTPLELVQSLYAAFGRGDIGFILAHVAEDCVWQTPGEGIPSAGRFIGPQGAAQFFERQGGSEDVTAFDVKEYFVNGNTVVALGFERVTVKATGKTAETDWAMMFRIAEGKVAWFQPFYDTAAYVRAHKA